MSSRLFGRTVALVFLALTLALVVSAASVNAWQSPPYPFPPTFPVNTFDFTLSASATLLKIQPGESGAVVVWLNLYCPNSTTTIRCDSTVLQRVDLTVSGCPGGAFCILDKQEVLMPPLYQAASNLIIYTFSTTPIGATTITVTGTDQFGQTHSVSVGVVACYC